MRQKEDRQRADRQIAKVRYDAASAGRSERAVHTGQCDRIKEMDRQSREAGGPTGARSQLALT
jgi:hypothetical protein